MTEIGLRYVGVPVEGIGGWECPLASVAFDEEGIVARLLALERP